MRPQTQGFSTGGEYRDALAARHAYTATARSILEKAIRENRGLTPAEEKDVSGLTGKIDKLSDQLADSPLYFGGGQLHEPAAPHNAGGRQLGAGRRYRETFKLESLSTGGFDTFEDFLRAIHTGLPSAQLEQLAGWREGVGSAGGFLVPDSFAGFLLDSSLEREIVRPRARIEPMPTETRHVSGFDTSSHAAHLFGGITGDWLSEGGSLTTAEGKTRKIQLKARKLGVLTKASNELIADGMTFEAALGTALINTIGWYLDHAFLRGDGAGKPLGILNDPALVTITKETGQAAATIVWNNLAKMFARLHPASISNAVWVCNNTAIPRLLTLTVPVGTGGNVIPALREDSGRFFVLGKEILFTEKLPALGTKGDIVLADLSQYIVGLRREVSLEKSVHVHFGTDEVAYRCILRADGQGSWNAPVTPNAGDSLSWCVSIETRS